MLYTSLLSLLLSLVALWMGHYEWNGLSYESGRLLFWVGLILAILTFIAELVSEVARQSRRQQADEPSGPIP